MLTERLAAGVLCVAAVAGPLSLGSTGPWPQFFVQATMAIAAALWVISSPHGGRVLILAFALAALFLLQLLPLPDGLLVNVAPVSVGRWKTALEGMPASWATISVDPAATAAAIRQVFLGLATIAAVAGLSRTPMFRRWFYTAIAVSGLLILASAFVFPVDPDNRSVMGFFSLRGPIDFWKSPERGPLQTSGFCYLDWVTAGNVRYQANGPISGDGFGTYI